ncbi:ABC transporter ATP-binding protein [Halospeciosus flavus]|uniref:ATP-binding cassette domain-containing protein n=1 Tax=Halospeciosus flavus TaxID=3032283 RepID=A0ABD5Z0N9_9EURY|nr:ABC transporter ATP-binding protein [Halospeciosus flavus]
MAALSLSGLSKFYGETRAVEDLSFSVREGEVFGFLGPNGAGKTTTIRTLLGFLHPTAGDATVLGVSIHDRDALQEARSRIGYLPSDPSIDPDLTGRRFLDEQAALKGDVRREELVERFDVPVDRRVGELSRGNRQKLAIVQAFVHDPSLAVLDEPTSGLDPLLQETFNTFLREERAAGTTVFFSSHVLSEVRKVCDRVAVVRDGHLAALEDVESLLSRGGKRVRVHVGEDVSASDFDIEGVHDLHVDDEVRFTFTGDYDDLVALLSRFSIRDLDVEEAPLEDVFVRFYGESESPRTDATRRPADTGGEGSV